MYKLKGEFRKYQQRVPDNAKEHLNDNHIHIVAAPGSGKTLTSFKAAILTTEIPTIDKEEETIRFIENAIRNE